MIDLTPIASAVIALVAAIISCVLIPFIRSKLTAAQFDEIQLWVNIAVDAAEQLFQGHNRGEEKKAYVLKFLQSKGFTLDMDSLDKMIEAAVLNLKHMTESGQTEKAEQTSQDE